MNRRKWLLPLIAAIVVPGAFLAWILLAGYTPDHNMSTFDASGKVAEDQLNLFWWIFWAAVFVFIIVEGAFVFAVFRFRARPGDAIPPQVHGHSRLEIGWTIAPAVIMAIVAVPTLITLWRIYDVPEQGDLEVEVVAHQWWWEFNYPALGVTTANEVHMPVDKKVVFTLKSPDVIHSFWIPKLGGKVDVVPGRANRMWLQGSEPGEYYGHCAEFCGESHAFMRFRAVVDTDDGFAAWVAKQKEPARPTSGLAATGEQLFMGKGLCLACHTVMGTNANAKAGPNLTHVGSRTTIAAGMLDNTEANLIKWLSDPNDLKPGNLMGTLITKGKFTEDELKALAAYLQSLQ